MPPPASPDYELVTKRDIPKINGSSGGFIALIVCLILVIIASSIGVFFLLKQEWNSHPTAEELIHRKQRRRYQNQSRGVPIPIITGGNEYAYNAASTSGTQPPPRNDNGGILNAIRGLMSVGHSRQQHRPGDGSRAVAGRRIRTRNDGWMKTGSGDDWDSGDEEFISPKRSGGSTSGARMQELHHGHNPSLVHSPMLSPTASSMGRDDDSSYFFHSPFHTAQATYSSTASYDVAEPPKRTPQVIHSPSLHTLNAMTPPAIRSRASSPRSGSPIPAHHHTSHLRTEPDFTSPSYDPVLSLSPSSSLQASLKIATPLQATFIPALNEDSPTFSTHSGEMKHFLGGTKFTESI